MITLGCRNDGNNLQNMCEDRYLHTSHLNFLQSFLWKLLLKTKWPAREILLLPDEGMYVDD